MKNRKTPRRTAAASAMHRKAWLLAGAWSLMGAGSAWAQCDADIPYAGNFSGASIPACYTVIDDNSDGYSWIGATQNGFTNTNVAKYDGQGGGAGELAPEDWLITLGLNTDDAVTYKLTFKYQVPFGNFNVFVGLQVYSGDAPTVPGMTNEVIDLGFVGGNAAVQEVEVDFTPGAGPTYIGFHVNDHSAGWNLGLQIGDISVVALSGPPACDLAVPGSLAANDITTSGAEVSWGAVIDAVDYEYEVRTSGAAGSGPGGLVASGTTASTSAVVGGLSPSTTYSLYVRARCADEEPAEAWSAALVFNTPCEAVSLPFFDGFAGLGNGQIPACYARENLNENEVLWGGWTASITGFTAPTMRMFQNNGANDAWFFLPPMDLNAGTSYRLTYKYGKAGNANPTMQAALQVRLGQQANGSDMLANGVLIHDHGTFITEAQEFAINFIPATSGVQYLGFRTNVGFSGAWTVVDDIGVAQTPACVDPFVSASPVIGSSDLSIDWDCMGCTGDFIVEYGLASIFNTPGSGLAPGANGTIASTTASAPFILSGLSGGETYRVYVRQQCDDDEFSFNGTASATTQLLNVDCVNAIYLECDGAQSASTVLAPLNATGDCGIGNSYGVWYVTEGTGGEFTLSTCAADGGAADFDTRIIVTTTDDCDDLVCVASGDSGSGCAADEARVTWFTTPGAEYYIYVGGPSDGFTRGAFTVTLSCEEAPTCLVPSDLSIVSVAFDEVTFNWVNTGAESYEYEVRSSGAAGSGPVGLEASGSGFTGGPVTASVPAESSLTLHLRGVCNGGDDQSPWISSSFSTPCSPASIPYDAAFTGATIPACYTVINVNEDAHTWVGATRSGFVNTSVAKYNNDDGFGVDPDDWMITRLLDTEAGSTYRISFRHQLSFNFPTGAVGLEVYAGTSNDIGSMNLLEDIGNIGSNVVTLRNVDFVATGGPLTIGFKAKPNSLGSGFTFSLYVGDIMVDRVDCEGVAGGSALPGTPCDDEDPTTENDTWDANCTCAGTPIGGAMVDMVLDIWTDAAGNETTWQIVPVGGGAPLQTGGPYPGNSFISESFQLAEGCYRLEVADAGDNGMGNGGYVLRTSTGSRIIDNRNAGDFGNLSALANEGGFCLPLGQDRLIEFNCDRMEFLAGDMIIATPNAAVSAQFQSEPPIPYTQQDATSGYQFWIFEPNGTYSRRIYQGLNVYNGWAANDPARAAYLNFSWIVNSPLPTDVVLNVRVRSRVQGDYAEFGPACRIMVLSEAPTCPTTKLVDNSNNSTFSCGVVRNFGMGQKIYANPVAGANRYQFRITNPGEGYQRNIASNNPALILNWVNNPMVASSDAYQVVVRVSFDGGANWCPFGDACDVFIVEPAAAEARMAAPLTVSMYPNPNRGDLLWLSFQAGEANAVQAATLDIFEMTGKHVYREVLHAQDGNYNDVVSLNGVLARGMYLVTVQMGSERITERLVIQ